MVTATLNDVTSSKKKSRPSSEEMAAAELVKLAKEQGLSLTGPDGLLKQFTKNVLETALNEETTEHLGHGIIVGIAFRPHGGDGFGLGEPLGVAQSTILHPAIRVMFEPGDGVTCAFAVP